ncbi:MAG TPA: arsenic resistance N-acetyltransferase ArsN2 [Gemmatimonadales bacterium]|jgi:N-acetylglutamate synthase-like GNAT family acetyltransferase|nr:arsenic resistance N-acetyltransferase ArsN2 [Gemmatimonadales bacterium]
MEIRPARREDLDAVRRLLADAALPLDGLEDQFGSGYAVAVESGRLTGAAGVERYGRYGLLRSVITAPDRRGRGIGEALVRDRLDWAGQEGLEEVYLLTTTGASYFPRLGFMPVAREKVPAEIRASGEFSSVCPSSAVVMLCPLGTPGSGGARP